MTSLNSTAVNITWNILIIPGISIDHYIVAYSPMFQDGKSQDRENRVVFDSSTTSGIINNLQAGDVYSFQVYAIVTVDGRLLEGERSTPVNVTGQYTYFSLPTLEKTSITL